jgi:hypothetical protein
VGKVTLKINGDEALSEKFLFKSNSDEATKVTGMKGLTLRKFFLAMKHLTLLKIEAMQRLTLHRLASSLSTLYKSMQKSPHIRAKHICKGKDNDVFQLCYGNYGNNKFFWQLPMEFIASSLLCFNIFCVKVLGQ